jgi:hypothetical protein
MAKNHTFEDIQAGDTVHYQAYAGKGRDGAEYKPSRGRAVMKGREGWVLNIGGRHGRTAVVGPDKFISVTKGRMK